MDMLKVIGLMILSLPSLASAQTAQKKLRQVAEQAAEIRQIWPGFPVSFSHAIYAGSGRTWLLSDQAELVGWEAAEQVGGLTIHKRKIDSLKSYDRPFFLGLELSPGVVADGIKDSDGVDTLFHESFHNHQNLMQSPADLTWDHAMLETDWVRFKNAEYNQLRRLLYLDDVASQLDEVSVYLGIRRYREQMMPAGSLHLERAMEWQEGVATYVGLHVDMLIKDGSFTERLLAYGDLLKQQASDLTEDFYRYDAYFHGAAVAHLLSQLVPDWQTRIAGGETPFAMLLDTAPVADMSAEAIEMIIGDGSANQVKQASAFNPQEQWNHSVSVSIDKGAGFTFNAVQLESKANGMLLRDVTDAYSAGDNLELSANVKHVFTGNHTAVFKAKLSDKKLKACEQSGEDLFVCGAGQSIRFKGIRINIRQPMQFSRDGDHWQVSPVLQ
jgi:hypothetical protein